MSSTDNESKVAAPIKEILKRELQDMCREQGLQITGTKNQLKTHITEYDNINQEEGSISNLSLDLNMSDDESCLDNIFEDDPFLV